MVFADDWGRHPSPCQHIVPRLLDRHPTLWVNTIGTRRPGRSADDLRKIATRLRQWSSPAWGRSSPRPNLTVINPPMWPGFRTPLARRLNAALIARTVNRALGPRRPGERRVAITTLPITADLVGRLAVDRWVYYCVDDLSVWPGLDRDAIESMERLQVGRVDAAIAASEPLRQRLAALGREAPLLAHGVDLAHWADAPAGDGGSPISWWPSATRPTVLF